MSDYLFRGKSVDTKEWVYGYLYITHEGKYEISNYNKELDIERYTYTVYPKSVGRYTELYYNGKKIFEGDIGWDAHNECYGVVEYSDGKFEYVWDDICTDLFEVYDDVDFVGTVYDNSELMK